MFKKFKFNSSYYSIVDVAVWRIISEIIFILWWLEKVWWPFDSCSPTESKLFYFNRKTMNKNDFFI